LVPAQKKNVISVNFFTTGDHADEPAEDQLVTNEYNFMGLFLNLQTIKPGSEQISPGGIAWKTYGTLMEGYTYDSVRTKAMNMTGTMDGAAFKKGTQYRYIIWAKATGNKTEAGSATYSFPSSFGISSVKRYNLDYSTTKYSSTGSSLNIYLTAAPSFFEAASTATASTISSPADALQLATTHTMTEGFNVQVAPNPSRNYFSVMVAASSTNEKITLRVMDMTGRIIEEENCGVGNQVIHIGDRFRSGLYIIEVREGNKVKQLKVIKQ
ncbi:MAG TPA: T9SS type A sorting domain-containing protein, partial [Flavisolibacter sp.]|nr:T9SS type A sorting domain-containing protein [Flavisolibacter sp.]